MKFYINRDRFTSALQLVSNIINTRSTNTILSNVLIETKNDKLSFTTTDLDLLIRCNVQATIVEEGAITLPVKKLTSIVRSLSDTNVNVSTLSLNKVKIVCGTSKYIISGISKDEYPSFPLIEYKNMCISLDKNVFKHMINSVSYAKYKNMTSNNLNSVFFSFETTKLSLVATDGRRLAFISKTINNSSNKNILIPGKTINELERVLVLGEYIKISLNQNHVTFTILVSTDIKIVDKIYIVSKIINGYYPNYKNVISIKSKYGILINRLLIAESLKRAALVTNDIHHTINLKFSKDTLEIIGNSPELGSSHESISIDYKGPEKSITFNPNFLIEPLKNINNDYIIFKFTDYTNPGIIQIPNNNFYLSVVMPINLH